MVPSWIVVVSAIELMGFLAFSLSIATAVPEQALTRVAQT